MYLYINLKKISKSYYYLSFFCYNRNNNKSDFHKKLNDKKKEENYFLPPNNDDCLINKITKFDDYYYSIKKIFIFFILSKILNLFNEKFILLIALNILIFYGPIEKKYPYFLFKSRMYLQQIFQGIFGLIKCFIPKYEEQQNKE